MQQPQSPSLPFASVPQGITLLELNKRIANAIDCQPDLHDVWVIAETADTKVNKGNCYTQLIQKEPATQATVARIDAAIWRYNYMRIAAKFYDATHCQLASGMKVMVLCSVTFHEQYGLKLNITDISPEYTLGDMVRQRMEIIKRLTSEGIINMNKELPWPAVPQRVAVISAAGAAGYGDFVNQLTSNGYGLKFYTALFQAVMQGVNTVPSIINALNRINAHQDTFDCVVIIRGGGATSDLNSFDNYELAVNIAQFPLPVITGIGHERDVTVLDYVAAKRVKTPTAAAEFLLSFGVNALAHLNDLRNSIASTTSSAIASCNKQLAYYESLIPSTARNVLESSRLKLDGYMKAVPIYVAGRIRGENSRLAHNVDMAKNATLQALAREKTRLDNLTGMVNLLSPRNTLNRGYSLTLAADGHAVTDAAQLKPGQIITTHFKTGHVKSTVQQQF